MNKLNKIKLYNDDCFNVFPKIKDNTIDLFLLDLPYGTTACKWDSCIDLDKMWVEIKRTMKPSAIICFFCTTKFGYSIIKSNEKWFKYDLIWEKSRKVGFLSANKRQLRKHENIYVFKEEQGIYNPQKTEGKPYNCKQGKQKDIYGIEDKEQVITHNKGDRHPTSIIEHETIYVFNGNNEDNEELINYSKNVLKYIGKTKTEIKKKIKDADHFFRYSRDNFSLPTEDTYKKLISIYNIDKMEGFIKYNDLEPIITYNPQKTEGTPYKTKESSLTNSYYRGGITEYKTLETENKGDRHPTSIIQHETTILKHNNPHKTIHRTEKPIGLLEYLIKTYSNENDTIMDFTMGSGSCGEACLNTKRDFIGVEMDKEIFTLAQNRINTHKKLLKTKI